MGMVDECLAENKIIAIVRGLKDKHVIPVAEALYNGGIRMMEITFDAAKGDADEISINQIKMLKEHFEGKLVIGAGTVLTPSVCHIAKNAGAEFVVSPNTDIEVIKETKKLGLCSIPGAMTPSEIQNAYLAGADYIKIFPANYLTPGYIRSVLAPLSHIKALAFGGIDEKNIVDFKNAGCCGFGIGSAIIRRDSIIEESYSDITLYAKRMSALIK